uniref:Uncharacterized protein n=1 Tax=Rhizophagus irregularis (strain DAOM 181602 / DAOM 197198 / MUCL 43194) TaxID=747089 RepID=U9TH40_RHIID
MKQTYFREPKYSKNYLIPSQQNLYKQYVNAFAFSEMVKSQNFKKELQQQAQSSWQEIKKYYSKSYLWTITNFCSSFFFQFPFKK